MRPTPSARTATTLVAAAAVIGFLAPSTATATTIEGYSPTVQREAVTSLAAEARISEAAATELLRKQTGSVDTLQKVTAALGSRAADGYLDDAAEPVVNVLDQAAADQVTATGARARVVKHSSAALAGAQNALQALPTVAHTSIGLDPKSNQVVLTVSDAAKGAEALVKAAEALGDRVRVERTTGEMHTAIYNGEAITGGGTRCSVGFNTNRGGQNYILDAGHCTRAVSQWNVGPSQGASFPTNDYGLIRNTTGSAPGAVTLWNGSTQRIASAGSATVGQRISKSGSTTHLTSGSVQRLNVTVNYAEGSVYQLIQTSALVNPGDSGGCLFSGSVGLGITSGKGSGTSYFQPLGEAMSAYSVTLNP
ncbi:S1 family peptidase [Amycolatopsis regifaucium]|uniref:Trypsin n=1 Tax=Amycolatopsis regifaucium TaxID=546365 RepID=A0A154MW70_9PSEU|nr:S1 family peptidase [Amycolatopsis regifaucium]KZB88515.1 trypsin [Amycolatopsis regifaucium]OKA07315.1 trypsin [Amycolatopsis regifaucium]SFI49249.1 Alpha-lytic protease prodomain-containing protein [Amycolatopsis regifaucium]